MVSTEPTRLQVLVADDNPSSLHFFRAALAELDAEGDGAGDGEEALQLASARRYDLLILDLCMPKLGGSQMLCRLRASADAASRQSPALASSAEPSAQLTAELRADGFLGLLGKPLSLDDLAAALARHVGWSRNGAAQRIAPNQEIDDAAALLAVGHRAETLLALRRLLLLELSAQGPAIEAWVADGEVARACAALHRLRASAGFCGTPLLERAIASLHAALTHGTAESARTLALQEFGRARNRVALALGRLA